MIPFIVILKTVTFNDSLRDPTSTYFREVAKRYSELLRTEINKDSSSLGISFVASSMHSFRLVERGSIVRRSVFFGVNKRAMLFGSNQNSTLTADWLRRKMNVSSERFLWWEI